LADPISAKYIKQIQNDQVPTPERHHDIFTDHITQKVIKQKQTCLVPVPERKADEGDKTFATRINVTEEHNANDAKKKRCYPERNSVKEPAKKPVEEHIVPAFCLAEVDFNVENNDGESDSSDYLQPVDKGNRGSDALKKLTSDIKEFCIAEVDFNIKRKDQCTGSKNNNNGESTDEIQNNKCWDLCIADLDFNVLNMEEYLEPSRSLQQIFDVESTRDETPITDSTGLCIAELNFEIEDNDFVSESADYIEPIESRVQAHRLQEEESETDKYQMLQNITNTELCISDSNALDMQSKENDEIVPSTCFADIDFQTILSEVEIMEKSVLDISYSAEKGYERLRSVETNITIPEEDLKNDTLLVSADEVPETDFSEIQNRGPLGFESEKVEQEASGGPHGSNNDEIKIDIDLERSL
jgi:hypothetical protein